MKLAIGIDTGGTCTDAVLYDFDTGRVLGRSKALTTYDDLARGILDALDGLDPALTRQAQVAGLSTTLATNACVEGKFRRTRLLLMGIDRRGIARYGADYGFTDPDDICYLPCQTTITGQVLEEPDWDTLRANARAWFSDVEGCAVCEIHGMRNGGVLEHKAARILAEQTGLPVVCASELFTGLSSLERAASALLNAGLLPVTRDFLHAVTAAFLQRGIHARVMIVRSDSSLMGREHSASHAVETLLSGPAASALGAAALTGCKQAVVVDIGGTTTDVALIEDGAPLLSGDGIRVGKWKTLVRGLFATSFALGGDSVVRWDKNSTLSLGPARVIPLCVLAAQHPDVLPVLERQVRETPAHSLPLHEFLTLARADWHGLPLDGAERALCQALEAGPLGLQQAADVAGVDKYSLHSARLEQMGVVLRAGLTPTDVMHVRGDYDRYDRRASMLAARFVAASLQVEPETLCAHIYEAVSRAVFDGVSQMLLEHEAPYYRRSGLDGGMRELLRLQWENRATGGGAMLRYAFRAPVALVGIGGPVHLFLPEAARALGAECIIPEGAATANAVGAVTGRMSAAAEAQIRPHGLSPGEEHSGDYEVLCDGQPPRCFAAEGEAIDWATEQLRARTGAQLHAQGAAGTPVYRCEVTEEIVGRVKLGTTVVVTADICLMQAKEE